MDAIQEKYIQELIGTGAGTEGQLLIPRKIHDALIEESDSNLIPRTEAALYIGPAMIPGSSYDIDLEVEFKMLVRVVAEGAEIFLDQDEYTSTNAKPKKYGVAIKVTAEMMEDAKWNLLERNIKKAAKRFAWNETALILTALDGADNTITGGAAITLANITYGMKYLEDKEKEATTMLAGTQIIYNLRNIDTFVEAQKSGNREMMETGYVGTIYGMNVVKFSTNAAPTTTYAKYAYITDKNECYYIAEKRPMQVENFTLPLFDMDGAAITQRITVGLLKSNAVCKITTT